MTKTQIERLKVIALEWGEDLDGEDALEELVIRITDNCLVCEKSIDEMLADEEKEIRNIRF